jgi:hypothetical protein
MIGVIGPSGAPRDSGYVSKVLQKEGMMCFKKGSSGMRVEPRS